MCEVEIKDESSSNDGQGSADMPGSNESGSAKPAKMHKRTKVDAMHDAASPLPNPMATSLDVLNLLRNGSFGANSAFGNKYTDEIHLIIEMQAKEHALRMDILRAQLETAKLNRDIAEINKILLLRNLQAHSE